MKIRTRDQISYRWQSYQQLPLSVPGPTFSLPSNVMTDSVVVLRTWIEQARLFGCYINNSIVLTNYRSNCFLYRVEFERYVF